MTTSVIGTGPRLVVWDVDRTLTRSDTLVPFLRAVTGSDWPGVTARVAGDLTRRGASRAQLKDALLRQSLGGRSLADVEGVAERFADWLAASGCRNDALARWRWHITAGDTLALASASPAIYIRPFAARLGTDLVVATELEEVDGHLTGARAGANCRGGEKARRIVELALQRNPRSIWAYSDSASDREMLAFADVPVQVRPWRRLHEPVAER